MKPAEAKKETICVVRKSRLESNRSWTIGSADRNSTTTNAARTSTPAMAGPAIAGDVHPRLGPSLRAYMTRPSPVPPRRSRGGRSGRDPAPDVRAGKGTRPAGDQPDGNVDVEGPAPGQTLDQQPTEDGTGGRPENRGEHEDATDCDALPGREGAVEHRHADGREHPAAGALQHPKCHQLLQALCLPAERRGGDEEGEGGEEDPFRAEAIAQPAGRGDEDGQADEIADDHRLRGDGGHVELAAERRQRHVDDRRVEGVHQHRGDVDRRHDVALIGRNEGARPVSQGRCRAVAVTCACSSFAGSLYGIGFAAQRDQQAKQRFP